MPQTSFAPAVVPDTTPDVPQHKTLVLAWPAVILGLALMLAYARVVLKLVYDWWMIPDFSHGFLVPLFSGYLLWSKRHVLRDTVAAPSLFGFPILLTAMSLLIVGTFGAELFLTRISLVLSLVGVTVLFFGWRHLRIAAFPISVLLLAIPIPAIIFNQITFPLQILASQLASKILPFLDVPVLREGNVIQLPAMPLEVAEACSGIRSLMSLGTLAIFYGYFLEQSNLKRILLVLLSVPIAVAANALRIVGTGLCVQYWDPDKALGFFHEFSGWVVFMVSLLFLYAAHKIMGMRRTEPPTQVVVA